MKLYTTETTTYLYHVSLEAQEATGSKYKYSGVSTLDYKVKDKESYDLLIEDIKSKLPNYPNYLNYVILSLSLLHQESSTTVTKET